MLSAFQKTNKNGVKRVRVLELHWRNMFGTLLSVLQVLKFVEECAELCDPKDIHVCDGTERENHKFMAIMESEGTAKQLSKHLNW